MSDHADVIREAMRAGLTVFSERDGDIYTAGCAALDALVAERDKALGIELSEVMDDLRAAEAELVTAKSVYASEHKLRTSIQKVYLQAVSERDEWRAKYYAEARVTELEADAETMYAVLRDSLAVSSARVTELEKVLLEISEKKCLNGDSTCDWPCVVCIARAALAKEDTDE